MMICLLFLSEAYMATISKQEMERVLRLSEIAGRGKNWVEVDSSYTGAREKSKMAICNKKGNKFPCIAVKASCIIKPSHTNYLSLS